jgi:hypothetical protein
MAQWISSYGQPNASDSAYYSVDQVQYISCGPSSDAYQVSLGITSGTVTTEQEIYSGLATLADAQAIASALAEQTGGVSTGF